MLNHLVLASAEHQLGGVGRQLPLTERVGDEIAEGHRALAVLRLWRADLLIAISTLADVQLALPEIDILPAQTAQLGSAKPGEGGNHEQRSPALGSMMDDCADLLLGGDAVADLELALVTLLQLTLPCFLLRRRSRTAL